MPIFKIVKNISWILLVSDYTGLIEPSSAQALPKPHLSLQSKKLKSNEGWFHIPRDRWQPHPNPNPDLKLNPNLPSPLKPSLKIPKLKFQTLLWTCENQPKYPGFDRQLKRKTLKFMFYYVPYVAFFQVGSVKPWFQPARFPPGHG